MAGVVQQVETANKSRRVPMMILVISLSINVFVFASLAMYLTWIVAGSLSDLWRGLTALAVWIATFGASTLVFWRIVQQISVEAIRV